MKLRKLTILKHKSIKEPQTIEFDDAGCPLTLVGLNGSGKSNVLEAIQLFFAGDDMPGRGRNLSNYIAVLEVDERDKKDLEPLIAHDLQDDFLRITFNGDKPYVKFIEYKPLTVAIKNERERLFEVKQRFNETVKSYVEKLKLAEHSVAYGRQYISVQDSKGNIHKSNFLNWIKTTWDGDIGQINEYCDKFINEDVIQVEKYGRSAQSIYRHSERNFNFKVVFDEEDFSPLEKKHIDFEAMRNDIDELNLQLAKDTKNLEDAWDEIVTVYNSIIDKIYSASERLELREEKEEKQRESFQQKIDKALSRKCYLLDNESSIIFGHGKEHLRYGAIRNSFLNLQNPIESAFFNYCVEAGILKGDKDKLNLESYDKKGQDLLRAEFERFINSAMPKSNHSQYKNIAVEIDAGKAFRLSIIENDGSKVEINETSLGRRWLLTYLFMKNNLGIDDFLLVDEPAAFLHPKAQKETLADLEEYAKSGRNVVLATHSPYMISNLMTSYYWVNMSQGQGTKVKKYTLSGFEDAKKKLGFLEFNDMILEGFYADNEKTILYVEGEGDVACIEKFLTVCKFDCAKYEVIPMGGADHAEWWHTNRASVGKADYRFFIDRDKEETITKRGIVPKEKIVFVGDNGKGSMEDLFFGADRESCFSRERTKRRLKIDGDKVAKIEKFDPQTVKAFKRLLEDAKLNKGGGITKGAK